MLISNVDWLLLLFNNSMLLDSVASDHSATDAVSETPVDMTIALGSSHCFVRVLFVQPEFSRT
jgi:hypothetical protein